MRGRDSDNLVPLWLPRLLGSHGFDRPVLAGGIQSSRRILISDFGFHSRWIRIRSHLDAVEEDAVASSVPATSETGRSSKFSDVWGHISETDGKWQCNHCKSSGITQVYIFLFCQIRIFVHF